MQKPRIFIVDDSKIQLILLEKILKNEGFATEAFTQGWELVEAVKERPPNLIISDIDMPSLDGFELMGEVKKQFTNKIPFFFVSSMQNRQVEKRAQQLGASTLLKKPFSTHSLMRAVEDMLGMGRVSM
jgi:CheY-like chemotaxis protein